MPRCAAEPKIGKGWSNSAATSPARPWPTNVSSATQPGKWCSNLIETPWREGATQLVMLRLESMERLAALVARPHGPAFEEFARRPRERLLRGDQLRAVDGADGSQHAGRYSELATCYPSSNLMQPETDTR